MFLLSHEATRPAVYSLSSTTFLSAVSQRTAAVPAEVARTDLQLLRSSAGSHCLHSRSAKGKCALISVTAIGSQVSYSNTA